MVNSYQNKKIINGKHPKFGTLHAKNQSEQQPLPMKHKGKKISDGLKTIATIDLTCKSASILERIFWVSLGICGTVWAIYFIMLLFYDENPIIMRKGNIPLTQLTYPAVTICPKSSTKYAVAERLGNYIDPEVKLPEELKSLRMKLLLSVIELKLNKTSWLDSNMNIVGNKINYTSSCGTKDAMKGCEV